MRRALGTREEDVATGSEPRGPSLHARDFARRRPAVERDDPQARHAVRICNLLESYRSAHRLSGGNVFMLGFQGGVLGRMGRHDDARQIVATLEQIARSRHVPPSAFALVFAGLGDHDAAIHYLDRAYASRDVFLISLPCAHWWGALRSDSRFRSLLQRTGFLQVGTVAR